MRPLHDVASSSSTQSSSRKSSLHSDTFSSHQQSPSQSQHSLLRPGRCHSPIRQRLLQPQQHLLVCRALPPTPPKQSPRPQRHGRRQSHQLHLRLGFIFRSRHGGPRRRTKRRGRPRSTRSPNSHSHDHSLHQPPTWKKLLWVKQSYPDNYTDEDTFLSHLQRNPRLRPYELWPLVADSTIIVQHVCSVVIFVCCFVGIFQERVGPQVVVGWATAGTVAGWGVREYWRMLEERHEKEEVEVGGEEGVAAPSEVSGSGTLEWGALGTSGTGASGSASSRLHSRNPSLTSLGGGLGGVGGGSFTFTPLTPTSDLHLAHIQTPPHPNNPPSLSPPYEDHTSTLSPRMRERLTTAKSALLIYSSLLGLSPILKSLTKSTSSDSIWALSSWLMILNVFTFDYGAGSETRFPASLSTNAGLMASTVLASRLPSTTHVFSLTLFSIEVFGLFPVFRRHLRGRSWSGHLWLTTFLVVLASGGLAMSISGGGWGVGMVGVVGGGLATCLMLGLTSWWLIGLQRYKNEIHGPWDPARPVIRRVWE